MEKELYDIISESINTDDARPYISWSFFYIYKDKIFQCEFIRELHNFPVEMGALLSKHHVGAPNPVSLEKLFKDSLPRAYKESHYTPRMSYFNHGDVNGDIYAFSFLIRTAKTVFCKHKKDNETKFDEMKNKIHMIILDAGDNGVSKSDLFKSYSRASAECRTNIIEQLIQSKLIYEERIGTKSLFFKYDQPTEDERVLSSIKPFAFLDADVKAFSDQMDKEYAEEQAAKAAQKKDVEVEEPTA